MKNSMSNLTAFLQKLEKGRIDYTVTHQREDALLVAVALPGERWEIEFFSDGTVEVEQFVSSGEIYDEEVLRELFDRYLDDSDVNEESTVERLVAQIG